MFWISGTISQETWFKSSTWAYWWVFGPCFSCRNTLLHAHMRAKNTRPHTSRRVRKTKPKTPAGSFHHLLHRGDVTPLHLPVIYLPCATASFVFSCTVLFLLTLCLNPRQEKQANLCASSCSLFFSSDGLKRHTAVSSETCGSAKPRGTLGGGGGVTKVTVYTGHDWWLLQSAATLPLLPN